MSRFNAFGAFCALSFVLASCAAPRPLRETTPVRIGIFADLSSTGARDGNDALKGAELRVDETNAEGGVGGRAVELVVQDMKQSSAEAIKAFTRLAQEDGASAVIGSVVPGSALAVSPVAELSKVPLVSLSMDDRVSTPDMKPDNPEPPGAARQFVFLLQPSATQTGSSLAGYVLEHSTMTRYASLFDPVNPVSVLQAHAFENVVRKSGRVVAASVVLPDGDFTTATQSLREASIDALYICASTERNAAAAKSIRAALPQVALLGNQAWYAQGTGTPAGLAGSAWFCMGVSPDDAGLVGITARFLSRFDEKPRPAVVPGWDAAGIIIAAVRKAGTSDPIRVRDALEQMTAFPALQGLIDMDRKTHRPAFVPVAIMRVIDGGIVTAEPRYVYRAAKPASTP